MDESSRCVHPATAEDLAGPTIVHCWAPWNAHDQVMDQRLGSVLGSVAVPVRSVCVDEDDWLDHVRSWGVLNLPALVLVRDGRAVRMHLGLGLSGSELLALLVRWSSLGG